MKTDRILYIIGCGGHARSVADVYMNINSANTIVFLDEKAKPQEKIFDYDVLSPSERLLNNNADYFIALGDNYIREQLFKKYERNKILSIVSSLSFISKFAKIGRGCFIGNFVHIGPDAEIGDNTIINNASVIEHGVKIGAHSHIAPNVAVSGNTIIGERVFIGVGASIRDNVSICNNVIVGAGSVVVKNISEEGVYAGCPAKRIK